MKCLYCNAELVRQKDIVNEDGSITKCYICPECNAEFEFNNWTMNSVELMDKKNQLKMKADAIVSGAEKESRKLTDEETSQFEALKKEIEDVDNEIRDLSNKLNKETTKRSMEKFSLLKAINDVANNRQLDERS